MSQPSHGQVQVQFNCMFIGPRAQGESPFAHHAAKRQHEKEPAFSQDKDATHYLTLLSTHLPL